MIRVQPGQVYSRSNQNLTVNRVFNPSFKGNIEENIPDDFKKIDTEVREIINENWQDFSRFEREKNPDLVFRSEEIMRELIKTKSEKAFQIIEERVNSTSSGESKKVYLVSMACLLVSNPTRPDTRNVSVTEANKNILKEGIYKEKSQELLKQVLGEILDQALKGLNSQSKL